jgi:site-specific recombinase XerD
MLEDGATEATVRRAYCTLRSALNAAVRERLIGDNPARYLQVPTGRRPHAVVWTRRRVKDWRRTGNRQAVAVWTPAQTRFLTAIAGYPLLAVLQLIALRGLRRGEACGVQWSDLDLDAGLPDGTGVSYIQEFVGLSGRVIDRAMRLLELYGPSPTELAVLHSTEIATWAALTVTQHSELLSQPGNRRSEP